MEKREVINTSPNEELGCAFEYYDKYDTIVRRLMAFGLNCLRIDDFKENGEPYEHETITIEHDIDDHSCFQDIIDDLIAVFEKYRMQERISILKLMNVSDAYTSKED